MRSPDKQTLLTEARITGLVILGLLLFLFESVIPRPLPWLKIGLANIVTLIALYWMGVRAAIIVAALRIFWGNVFTGNLLTPGFFLSISGGFLSTAAMILIYETIPVGILTLSALGGGFHLLGQLLCAQFFLFNNPLFLKYAAPLIVTGMLSGALVGLFAFWVLSRLQKAYQFSFN